MANNFINDLLKVVQQQEQARMAPAGYTALAANQAPGITPPGPAANGAAGAVPATPPAMIPATATPAATEQAPGTTPEQPGTLSTIMADPKFAQLALQFAGSLMESDNLGTAIKDTLGAYNSLSAYEADQKAKKDKALADAKPKPSSLRDLTGAAEDLSSVWLNQNKGATEGTKQQANMATAVLRGEQAKTQPSVAAKNYASAASSRSTAALNAQRTEALKDYDPDSGESVASSLGLDTSEGDTSYMENPDWQKNYNKANPSKKPFYQEFTSTNRTELFNAINTDSRFDDVAPETAADQIIANSNFTEQDEAVVRDIVERSYVVKTARQKAAIAAAEAEAAQAAADDLREAEIKDAAVPAFQKNYPSPY